MQNVMVLTLNPILSRYVIAKRNGYATMKAFQPEIGGAKFVITLPLEVERAVTLEQAS